MLYSEFKVTPRTLGRLIAKKKIAGKAAGEGIRQAVKKAPPTPSLIGKTLIEKKLPPKGEILKAAGARTKEFLKNPIKETKAGLKRDKFARETYARATGQAPKTATKNVAKNIGKSVYEGGGKDLAVNLGGLAGSKIGNVAGVPGNLAGDYFGARLARRGLDDTEALTKALKIRKNPKFRQLPAKQQMGIIRKRAKGYKKKIADDLAGDRVGWAIGNTSAMGLEKVGSPIPLQGGLTAMHTVGPAIQAGRVTKRTGSIRKGLESMRRNTAKNLDYKRKYRKMLDKEQKMMDRIDKGLKKLPDVPPGYIFSLAKNIATFSLQNKAKRKLLIAKP